MPKPLARKLIKRALKLNELLETKEYSQILRNISLIKARDEQRELDQSPHVEMYVPNVPEVLNVQTEEERRDENGELIIEF